MVWTHARPAPPARERAGYPAIALVGYTNAGKSTLFNRLTGAAVGARDQLFATLDPTMRVLDLPSGQQAILSDTVGFVADLPTDLIAAFRPRWRRCAPRIWCCTRATWLTPSAAQRQDVLGAAQSGAGRAWDEGRLLEFWNKLDLLPAEDRAQLRSAAERSRRRYAVPLDRRGDRGAARPRS